MPKVSIITTAYKHEKFIAETIESILSQTFTDWELLIGDDSPDDKTWKIIKKYTNKFPNKIKAWHNKTNKGIVGNMNFLISKSDNDSKYITFLEGDDLYTIDNLEKKIKIFEKYPKVGMVYNNLDFIDEKGKLIEKNYFKNAVKILKNEKLNLYLDKFLNLGLFYGTYSSLMFKKNIIKKIGIKNLGYKNFLTSDWILFGEIGKLYNCYGIKNSLTLYRRHYLNLTLDKIKLYKDFILSMEFFKKKYNILSIEYKINYLKMFVNYFEDNRFNTIKYGIITFKYSLKKEFVIRCGIIIFSLLPKKLNNFLYNKFKK